MVLAVQVSECIGISKKIIVLMLRVGLTSVATRQGVRDVINKDEILKHFLKEGSFFV